MDFAGVLIAVLIAAPSVTVLIMRRGITRNADRALRPAARIETAISAGAIILAAAGVFTWLNRFPLNHDTSWYLVATRKWLDGAVLYRDIVEVNPPLVFYLTRPALWIADLVGVDDKAGMLLYLLALICLSLFVVQSLLAEASVSPVQRRGMLAAAAVALLVMPLEEFGQREHIMVILVLPYLMAQMLRPMGLRVSPAQDVAIALIALAGLSLKPYFLALPLCLTLLDLWRSRRIWRVFTPANLTIGLGVMAYLVFIILVHPEYLNEVVPMARLVYGAYGTSADWVIANPVLISMLLAVILWRRTDMPGNAGAAAQVLIAAGVAFGLTYLAQFKGYRYQSFPMEVASVLAVAWILASRYSYVLRSPFRAIVAAVVLWLAIGTSIWAGSYRAGYLPILKAALPEDVSGRKVMVFSAHVSGSFPFVLEAGAIWTSRYPHQWLIPGAVSQLEALDCARAPPRCQALRDVLSYARDTAAEDFIRQRPDVVLVDKQNPKPYFNGVDFDYIEFMSSDPAFAEVWSEYTRYSEALIYEIWWRGASGG